jgi:DNA polymerase
MQRLAGPTVVSKLRRLRLLSRQAHACTLCPRLASRTAVLSRLNGDPHARILMIGEAPGRRGADRTRVPFSGDQSGRNLDAILAAAGLSRGEIFFTSAVLCCPEEDGHNTRPRAAEIANCQPFLKAVIELVAPRIVATLGSVGLEALGRLYGRRWKLADIVGRPIEMETFTLMALYHPSPQVIITARSLAQQSADMKELAALARRLKVLSYAGEAAGTA